MTVTTDTTDLAALLANKRAAVEEPREEQVEPAPEVEVMPTIHTSAEIPVTEHGEIVPVATAPVVEYEPQYPTIPPKVVGGLPYVRDYMKLARTIHSTEMVPAALKGRPDAILACFLQGYELGLGPMQALNGIDIIEGRPALSAELMRALVQQAGHLMIPEVDNDKATVEVRRSDWPEGMTKTVTFTMADAERAGLAGKNVWKKYPRAMLTARATSEAGRTYFPDVLAGMSYTPEEVQSFSQNDGGAPSQPTQPPADASPASPLATPTEASTPSAPSTESPSPTTSPTVPSTASTEPATAAPAPPAPASPPPPATEVPDTDALAPSVSKAKRTPKADRTPEEQAVVEQDSAARLELRKGLTALINSLDAPHQPLCRAYLAQNGYGDLPKLSAHRLQEAIDIAAGWPETASSTIHPANPTPDPDGEDIIDAEIVEEDGNDAQALFDQLGRD